MVAENKPVFGSASGAFFLFIRSLRSLISSSPPPPLSTSRRAVEPPPPPDVISYLHARGGLRHAVAAWWLPHRRSPSDSLSPPSCSQVDLPLLTHQLAVKMQVRPTGPIYGGEMLGCSLCWSYHSFNVLYCTGVLKKVRQPLHVYISMNGSLSACLVRDWLYPELVDLE